MVIDEKNYSIINHFTEISNSFHQYSKNQGNDENFTCEFIIVNNNVLNDLDLQYLSMHSSVRLISLKVSVERGTAIQIGSFSASGRFILYVSLSEPLHLLYNIINSYKSNLNGDYCVIIPIRQNCPKLTLFQRYLIFWQYVNKIHDFNFESFIISRKLAQVVLENIHFPLHEPFNLEFLMILKYYRLEITEIPVDVDFCKQKIGFKEKIKSRFSSIGLVIAQILNVYKYDLKLPLFNNANNGNFYSRINL